MNGDYVDVVGRPFLSVPENFINSLHTIYQRRDKSPKYSPEKLFI